MTPAQADCIRQRFYCTPGWDELKKHEPRLVAALKALPDEAPMILVNSILRELYADAKAEAERLYPVPTALPR